MNHIDVNDEFVNSLFENAGWDRFGVHVERKTSDKPNLSESVDHEEEDLHEHEEEGYACPLCESHLEEPLDEERIAEHIDTVLTLVSESLNEDVEDEDYDEDEEAGTEADSPLAEKRMTGSKNNSARRGPSHLAGGSRTGRTGESPRAMRRRSQDEEPGQSEVTARGRQHRSPLVPWQRDSGRVSKSKASLARTRRQREEPSDLPS